jgi:hypothetical protein
VCVGSSVCFSVWCLFVHPFEKPNRSSFTFTFTPRLWDTTQLSSLCRKAGVQLCSPHPRHPRHPTGSPPASPPIVLNMALSFCRVSPSDILPSLSHAQDAPEAPLDLHSMAHVVADVCARVPQLPPPPHPPLRPYVPALFPSPPALPPAFSPSCVTFFPTLLSAARGYFPSTHTPSPAPALWPTPPLRASPRALSFVSHHAPPLAPGPPVRARAPFRFEVRSRWCAPPHCQPCLRRWGWGRVGTT